MVLIKSFNHLSSDRGSAATGSGQTKGWRRSLINGCKINRLLNERCCRSWMDFNRKFAGETDFSRAPLTHFRDADAEIQRQSCPARTYGRARARTHADARTELSELLLQWANYNYSSLKFNSLNWILFTGVPRSQPNVAVNFDLIFVRSPLCVVFSLSEQACF